MKKARYYIRIYGMIISQYLKERMTYRADFVCEMLGMITENLLGIVTFWVIFRNVDQIAGWSFEKLVFLYGFSLIAMSPQQLFLDNAWRVSHQVVTGNFIKYCFRPVNILFYYMSEMLDVKGFSQFGIGVAVLVWAWIKLAIPLTFFNIFMLVFQWIGASLICMALIILSSACGFMGGGTNAAVYLASDLKSYGKYPLTIFNKVLKVIFTVIVPIGFIAYYPASFFLSETAEISVLSYFSPLIGLAAFLLSSKVWIYFANHYSGTGS